MPPTNAASELLNELYRQKVASEERYASIRPSVQPAEPTESRIESTRAAANASAFRGLAFGLPLALVLWGLPMIAWLATGSPWLGAAAAVLEFAGAAWLFWAQRSPIGQGRHP